tara:strand:- start:15038 stop:28432 length:13395 start_codon:yes stop_codon:yes gene_type:complete
MIQTGFESRVKIQDIISNQLPNYILDESPLTSDFLKQYYISQEYQGGPIDLSDNLDQYLKLDNLTPDVIVDSTTLSEDISSTDLTITVSDTKGFPNSYGLLKIDNEIITYTEKTSTTFTGCERGFSGITSYHQSLNSEELIFSTSDAASHKKDSSIQNLSSLFLKEFYKKTKRTFTPGLEDSTFTSDLDAGNFIREAKSLYDTKGTDESFRILFNILYNETPDIINLEERLIKPSTSKYVRRRIAVGEVIQGNPTKLKGQSIFKSKLNNTDINVSVSEVEAFVRTGIGTYYKFGLFIDNSGSDEISNTFNIIPNSRVIGNVSVGSSIITVDSTVGFSTSGTLITGDNTSIQYTSKTINQFLGVSDITSDIKSMDNVRSDDYYYGYEDGDITKEVRLRFTGVLSEFVQDGKLIVDEGDIIGIKNIGDKIDNPENNSTFKEIFANSWIYNSSSSYKLKYDPLQATSVTFFSPVDRSSLKYGDDIEIVDDGSKDIVYPTPTSDLPYVSQELENGEVGVNLSNYTHTLGENSHQSLRRKLKTANSSNTPIQFGNDNVTSDVQNVYVKDDVAYVASNSLPSYSSIGSFPYNEQITVNIRTSTLDFDGSAGGKLEDIIDVSSDLYSTISFESPHPFKNGDKIYYDPSESSLVGLETGIYYIKKISGNKIKLYGSTSGILGDRYIPLGYPPTEFDGNHKFTLYSQKSGVIGPQKLLKKFPLKQNLKNGTSVETLPGGTGMLVNGVEINNYKSLDKIHYGPINSVSVLNSGEDYDVINPPNITLSSPISTGTTALIHPVLSGKIDKILLDNQDFDIDSIVSIGITGGNSSGYALQPIFKTRYREIEFNAKKSPAGGINTSPGDPASCQITFLSNHNLTTGQSVVYESIGNPEVGVGIGTSTLVNFSTYYVERINQDTIRLYNSLSDANGTSLNGIGGIGINTIHLNGSGSGVQRFVVNQKNTLSSVKVLDGGNYTNRSLLVKPSGISTSLNNITFKNHGFNSGELIQYSAVDGISNKIDGLSFDNQYYVLKDNDDSFRLCDAGIGGTISQNYISRNIVSLGSTTGVGYQQFKYPDIKGYLQIINSDGGQNNIEEIPITPVIKGSITDIILYESGSGYGSTILNNIKSPIVTIKTGKDAELRPFFNNGKISDVSVEYGGEDYYSLPDLEVVDPTGSGSGAELRPIITNLKITGVEISNAGIGYSSSSSILIKSSGKNLILKPEIRSLTVNNQVRFKEDSKHYQLVDTENNLKYTAYGYKPDTFGDSVTEGSSASKLIGWAYDGNPIYGGYGLVSPNENPSNPNAPTKRMQSGYTLDISKVVDRPIGFSNGYFVDDYTYDNSGDLDEYNGRFEKTVDFPDGVYAYHATLDEDNDPTFPYFIGNKYRSIPIEENLTTFDQLSFDFNTSGVLRNTLPYKVSDINADNDFIVESSEVDTQEIEIESISSGNISEFDLLNRGSGYKVNENLNFDNSGTEGQGLLARVRSLDGKDLQSINTDIETYTNSVLTWNDRKLTVTVDPHHNFNENDYITISGISTDLSHINGSYKVGITSFVSNTISTIAASPSAGFTTEIYVSRIPTVSIGSSIQIGSEKMKILNIFENLNVLRVKRGNNSSDYTVEIPENSRVEFLTNSFKIDEKVDYFDSSISDKIYFNPSKSVGVGVDDGTTHSVVFNFAGNDIVRNIPIKQLYIENHPFHNNQKVNLTVPSGYGNANNFGNVSISTNKTSTQFDLPTSDLYIVNKGINTIGIKTGIGTASDGYEYEEVYFRNIHSMDDDNYLLESADDKQVLCKAQRIRTVVSVSTSHNLTNNDSVSLEVKPNISSGIGSDVNVEVKRDILTGHLLINPITFSSGDINLGNNTITLGSKGSNLKTGDKVLYSGDATGLTPGNYYVYKVDDKIIKLCQTYYDATRIVPNIVDITGTGSTGQIISLVNPQILATKNTDLVFDHSDSSLTGYNFNLYYDQEFKNRFVGTGKTSSFNVSAQSSITTVSYGSSLSRKLYYNIEKSGFISTSDTDVINNSEIVYIDSVYHGDYKISGVGNTDFTIYLNKIPEKSSYTSTQCDLLKYTTTSKSYSGPIDKIEIISGGSGYKKVPTFVGVGSTSIGKDAVIIPKSKNIGNVSKIRIINQGFEYSSDKTLNPTAYVSPIIELKNSNSIGIVTVTSGGKNYLSSPNIVIVNSETRKLIDSGFLEPKMIDNSILDVNIVEKPHGLPDSTVTLKTTNNTNGITISSVDSSTPASDTGYTVILVTPTLGFKEAPFKAGDKVFIEGIEKYGVLGDGFNSENLGYEFLTIESIVGGDNPNPFKFTVSAVGLTTMVGTAVTTPTGFTAVIPESDYPTLIATQSKEGFDIGEFITVNSIDSQIKVTSNDDSSIKVTGLGVDDLSVGDVILGKTSGNKATISKITENHGKYEIDFSSVKDVGWIDSVGRLNDDSQVIPDNDYYQNLSYSVKSSITWDTLQTPVNNVLHTSGLKNFADTGITSTASVGIGYSIGTTIIRDIFEEKRVDEIQGVDLVRDTEVTGDVARLIEFKNIRLSDYIACLTNEVFTFDNINQQFSNLEDTETYYVDLMDIPADGRYQNFIVRVESNTNTGISTQVQLSELVLINSYPYSNNDQNVLLEKYQLFNSDNDGFVSVEKDQLGTFKIVKDELTAVNTLRFYPKEKFNVDYDLKILKGEFTNVVSTAATVKVGPIDNSIFVQQVTSGSTNDILSVGITSINSFFVNAQIVDKSTGQLNFVEAYVTHNGQDSFISESYIDSEPSIISSNRIGILTSNLDSGTLKLSYENDTSTDVIVRSKVVGFGTTGFITPEGHTGVGTYRFQNPAEPDGYERSVIYQGISTSGVGKTTILGISSSLFNSATSIVEVSIGSSKAVHEVLSLHDGIDVYVQPAQFLADSSNNLGLGTFGGEYDPASGDYVVSFYPDNLVGVTTVSIFNKCFYRSIDRFNISDTLVYGSGYTENLDFKLYNAINGFRISKKDFELTTNSIPVFSKKVNPSFESDLVLSTGKFKVNDHFFRTNQTLSYEPKSTILGIGSTAMQYMSADNIMDTLPSTVFAIKNDDNTFQISTTRTGTAVTFTGIGEGNAHTFSMVNPNEKSIISIDDIVQYPITPTPISHKLRYNDGGQIGFANTIFSLSGISTILVDDIIKIDNEYMKVINVGVGTTGAGPITPGIGTFPCVGVERGALGTLSSIHTNEAVVDRFKGSFNIVDSTLWFATPPRGNPTLSILPNGLKFPTSDFNGRTFLRNDYTTNDVYDDISDQFNGLTTSFTLTVGGANTIGIGTSGGNGVLFINGIFQTPTTDNNPANNFKIIETGSGATGVTSVVFSGITSTDGTLIKSEYDINRNELPRGGIPISFGSTTGSGYAPLVGANVRPILDASGSITSIVGVATTGAALGVHTAVYDNTSGILTVTTIVDHQLVDGGHVDEVKLSRLGFTCPSGSGITTNYFPSGAYGDTFSIIGVEDTNKFSVNVGTSTIPHTYVGAGDSSGTVFPWYGDLTLGSGYNGIVPISVTVKDSGYDHEFISATNNAITKTTWNGTGITPTNAIFDSLSGIVTFTATSHGLVTGDKVGIATGSLTFKCSKDNYASEHKYPRGPFTHQFDSADANAVNNSLQPIGADYNALTGDMVLTFASAHNISNGAFITITDNSIRFKCAKDNYTTIHSYPRLSDPASGSNLTVSNATANDLTVNVGASNTKEDPVTGILTTVTKLNNNIFSVFVGSAVGEDANITATPKTVNTHVFDSANSTLSNCIFINNWSGSGGQKSISGAAYTASTGELMLDIGTTGMPSAGSDKVGIKTSSLAFRCNQDDYNSVHKYPRTSDPVNGTLIDITKVDTNTGMIFVNVGKSNTNCGGALDFTVVGGGTSYTNPKIFVTEPSYAGLGITGVSRVGEGPTTDTGFGLRLDVEVGAAQTSGIGSGFYEISNFDITRSGYSFKRGDVFSPIGLVTDRKLYEPFEQATIEVDNIYTDNFSMWQFGEFDYIDSIKNYQDGIRTRFPLFYNGSKISVDADPNFDSILANVMFVVVNGVIQQPIESYDFIGGASINFTMPLDPEDNVAIFFYKGTDNEDAVVSTGTTVYLELGDTVEISGIGTIAEQDDRIIKSLNTSTSLETNLYTSVGINDDVYRPINLIKQKQDKIIDREFISKKRVNLEPLILPAAKIISDVTTSNTTFFVDNAHLFDYEGSSSQFSGIIVSGKENPSIPSATATINTTATTVTSISVTGGSGYTSVPSVSISAPPEIGVGIGTTATATATISNGTVDNITVTEVGLGYTIAPKVLIEPPDSIDELVKCPTGSNITVESTSGIITGIGTTTVGSLLGIKFFAKGPTVASFNPISVGNPIYVYDTAVGTGLTSMNVANTTAVGIGTSFTDNVYSVAEFTTRGDGNNEFLGIITCVIKSDTNVVGFASTGASINDPVGYYSVGKLSGFDRSSSPISIGVNGLTVDVGLTTYPTLQRRGGPGDDTWKQTGGLITPE